VPYRPPRSVASAAARSLAVRGEKPSSQRGMTPVGIARARDLSNRAALSLTTVRRMLGYFSRHLPDKQGATWIEQGKGWQAWHGWGGDAGARWAIRIVRREDRDWFDQWATRPRNRALMRHLRRAR